VYARNVRRAEQYEGIWLGVLRDAAEDGSGSVTGVYPAGMGDDSGDYFVFTDVGLLAYPCAVFKVTLRRHPAYTADVWIKTLRYWDSG
jgi:hypothetical protein